MTAPSPTEIDGRGPRGWTSRASPAPRSPRTRPSRRAQTRQAQIRGNPFVTTATTEVDCSSGTGGYGPPYNHASSEQHIAFIYLQKWLGVSHPIDTAGDYVLTPLRSIAGQPALQAAVTRYQGAPVNKQTAWAAAYENGPTKAKTNPDGSPSVPAGNYGPLPTMMGGLLSFVKAGGLDGALLTSRQLFQTDYTKPLLLMADGSVLADRAQAQHLLGDQWGMMNETGSYPGQGCGCTPSGTRSSRSRPRPTPTSS